jgi:UDP-N-acetylglucosamine/UDP-N-acetylgalactosamine 4-epimerase
MTKYELLESELRNSPHTWLVTGAAGFIGSHLVEKLLNLDQTVIALDNLSTGKQRNLDDVRASVTPERCSRLRFVHGDTRNLKDCETACRSANYVLHQGALGSVPRSLADPVGTHSSNVTGFLNMLVAARDAGVSRFVYASSSSVYGDHPRLPKVEEEIGKPLSPYAATKRMNEIYAEVFQRSYGLSVTGLRYFNVFGPRQDPEGAYSAVIPRWFAALLRLEPIQINGDGDTSRDFCFIDNVVQANLLAATASSPSHPGRVYNVAYGERTTLNQLYALIRDCVGAELNVATAKTPVYCAERAGDVRHSLADISLARSQLGYQPTTSLRAGISRTCSWYVRRYHSRTTVPAVGTS